MWICTARYWGIWVSFFGGLWGCSIFSGNCHKLESARHTWNRLWCILHNQRDVSISVYFFLSFFLSFFLGWPGRRPNLITLKRLKIAWIERCREISLFVPSNKSHDSHQTSMFFYPSFVSSANQIKNRHNTVVPKKKRFSFGKDDTIPSKRKSPRTTGRLIT